MKEESTEQLINDWIDRHTNKPESSGDMVQDFIDRQNKKKKATFPPHGDAVVATIKYNHPQASPKNKRSHNKSNGGKQ